MEERKTAMVFDIQRYSLHDGPGIRTMIFLKGCPLKCLWCCNPESQQTYQETEFYKDLCVGCGACQEACGCSAISMGSAENRIDKSKCRNCGNCVEVCPHNALRTVGRQMDAEGVLKEIKRDTKIFKKSGGGVTLSGGEPLVWIDFCEEVLTACYDSNIHTAIETTGHVPESYFARIKDHVDTFLYDIKSMDNSRHRRLTGVFNQQIQQNIRYLRKHGKNVIIRVPLIPEHNFLAEEIEGLFRLADQLGIQEINFMPYHNLGEVKYERLFRPYPLKGLVPLKFSENMEEQIAKYHYIFEKHRDITINIG